MLTVGSLVADCGLELIAGDGMRRAADPLGAHLRARGPDAVALGRELLLTTGIQLTRRLASAALSTGSRTRVAGLGFGTGLTTSACPKALVERPSERGFPLFEVPFEMPFIAITERAFTRSSTSSTRVLRAGTRCRAARALVIEGRGLDEPSASLAAAIGGTASSGCSRPRLAASANFASPTRRPR